VESVSGCSWNECPDQRGITVRMRVEWVSESAWNPQNGHREMLATAKKGETSGLSGWFLIDCSLSKSTRT